MNSAREVLIWAGTGLKEFGALLLDPMPTMHLTHLDMILAAVYLYFSLWLVLKFIWPLNKRLALFMLAASILGEIFFVDFFQKHNMDVISHRKVVDWCDLGQHITSEFPSASELCSSQRQMANTTKWMGAKQYVLAIWQLIWHEIFKRWATDGYLKIMIPVMLFFAALLISWHRIRIEEIGTHERMMNIVSNNFKDNFNDENREFMATGRKVLEDSRRLQNNLLRGMNSSTPSTPTRGEASITEMSGADGSPLDEE